MKDLLIDAAQGKETERPPVWLMRQAGRYLPEYRKIRENYSFKEAVQTPEIAEKISLLPWREFNVDGVIIFSDILIALETVGFEYKLGENGPVIDSPIQGPEDMNLKKGNVKEKIQYVGELTERVSDSVGNEAGVIGFAGGPYTLALYAIEGSDKMKTRSFMLKYPDAFYRLLEKLSEVVTEILKFQEEHGADIVQLFDTWSGLLSPDDYRDFVLPMQRKIVENIDVPSILFTRNSGGKLDILSETGADVISVDWTVDISKVREEISEKSIQGNLDPAYLLGNKKRVREKTESIINKAKGKGHILNLGHGVPKDAKVENVRTFVETAKKSN